MTEPSDLSRVYARYLPPIRAKCRRLLGYSPMAEDVAQEALLRLWRSGVGEGSDVRVIMAWLYRTCTRLALDVLREQRRGDGGDFDLDAAPCGIDLRARVEARAAVAALAKSVTDDELSAAVLCRVDGLSQPEAALVLSLSERTVRRLLERFDDRVGALRKEFSS